MRQEPALVSAIALVPGRLDFGFDVLKFGLSSGHVSMRSLLMREPACAPYAAIARLALVGGLIVIVALAWMERASPVTRMPFYLRLIRHRSRAIPLAGAFTRSYQALVARLRSTIREVAEHLLRSRPPRQEIWVDRAESPQGPENHL